MNNVFQMSIALIIALSSTSYSSYSQTVERRDDVFLNSIYKQITDYLERKSKQVEESEKISPDDGKWLKNRLNICHRRYTGILGFRGCLIDYLEKHNEKNKQGCYPCIADLPYVSENDNRIEKMYEGIVNNCIETGKCTLKEETDQDISAFLASLYNQITDHMKLAKKTKKDEL